jgi:hypothetical protein
MAYVFPVCTWIQEPELIIAELKREINRFVDERSTGSVCVEISSPGYGPEDMRTPTEVINGAPAHIVDELKAVMLPYYFPCCESYFIHREECKGKR